MSPDITIKDAAEIWRLKHTEKLSDSSKRGIERELRAYLYPQIGTTLVSEAKPGDLLDHLHWISAQCPSLAPRMVQRLVKIFNLSIIYEIRDDNPAQVVSEFVTKPKSEHHKHLNFEQLPTLFDAVKTHSEDDPATTEAFWLIMHTALRRSEVIGARWTEIDFEKKIWTIPASRMKMKIEHKQMLSTTVCRRLKRWQKKCSENLGSFIFPGESGEGTIKKQSPLYMIYKAGFGGRMTLHGIRHIFSTAAHESGLFSIDAIELQQAHKIHGVRGTYNHALMIKERHKLANWWSKHIT